MANHVLNLLNIDDAQTRKLPMFLHTKEVIAFKILSIWTGFNELHKTVQWYELYVFFYLNHIVNIIFKSSDDLIKMWIHLSSGAQSACPRWFWPNHNPLSSALPLPLHAQEAHAAASLDIIYLVHRSSFNLEIVCYCYFIAVDLV